MAIELVLNGSVLLHSITESGSLFHSCATTLVKKNLVQSAFTCLHVLPLFCLKRVIKSDCKTNKNFEALHTLAVFLRGGPLPERTCEETNLAL